MGSAEQWHRILAPLLTALTFTVLFHLSLLVLWGSPVTSFLIPIYPPFTTALYYNSKCFNT